MAVAWLLLPLLHAALSHRVAAMQVGGGDAGAGDCSPQSRGRGGTPRFAAAPLDLTLRKTDPPGRERERPRRAAVGLAHPLPFICHSSRRRVAIGHGRTRLWRYTIRQEPQWLVRSLPSLGSSPFAAGITREALTLTNVSARQGGGLPADNRRDLRIWPGHGRLSRYLPARGRREGSARTKSRSSVVRARARSVNLRLYARSHGHGHGGPRRTASPLGSVHSV